MAGAKTTASTNVQKTTENHTEGVNDQTRGWMQDIYGAGQAAGNAGPSPLLTGAGQFGTSAQGAGNLGLSAMSGDPAAAAKMMNPYQQQVIDANNAQWQKTNQQTMNQTNDAATRAGAFGGSRHGVAEGVALGNNNAAQMQQNAGLLSSGYQQSMDRAGQLAGYGMAGANLNANLGFGGVGSPEQWRLMQLKQGFMGPTGSSSGGAQTTFGAQAGIQGRVGIP